ncbi:MAG: acetyl-CoA carboxylase carboxyltransferase subunit beta [Clostridiales bacterium]|nr:acetyl-CoA carboxylase carboxyltransferase subunit beta [Clostridiales bacterium]
MELRYLFKKTQTNDQPETSEEQIPSAPQGLFHKCARCGETIFSEELRKDLFVCPSCGNYFRMYASTRIAMMADEGTFEEWDTDIKETNPLGTPGYEDKLAKLRDKTGLDEAVATGKCLIGGNPAAIAVMDCRFMMASMGEVVGEKITRMVEKATEQKLPVIIFTASGGARMQEGIVSLMQMAKTSAALKRHSDAGFLYITVLTDPTTGGVTASFAMLGDIILAEPEALIGFAGPRVIEQTIGQKLPAGFQRSEYLKEHGFVDDIVARSDMKDYIGRILAMHENRGELKEVKYKETKIPKKTGKLTPWDRVMISRGKDRPVAEDYIEDIFPDFIEFHGDRYVRDDQAIMGGIATFAGRTVTVIAESKGHDTKENVVRNFGMPSPDGYRKALRLMKQAEKFGRPVICFVDTPGAYCGLEAEERGQGEAIARNLYEMSSLKVPVLSVIISEAGSGGALALAVSDQIWMLENSIYAILSPEGYASILWKDSKRANEAAAEMKLTAKDMLELGIVEKVIDEPEDLKEENLDAVTSRIKNGLTAFIKDNLEFDSEAVIEARYQRYRKFGA